MAKSSEGNKCHLLKSGFHVSKSREPSPQRDQTTPPIFTPHLSAAHITLISAACLSHGPGAEAEKRAISVQAAKQFVLPPITRDESRHFRLASIV